jgi:hypothetical protein
VPRSTPIDRRQVACRCRRRSRTACRCGGEKRTLSEGRSDPPGKTVEPRLPRPLGSPTWSRKARREEEEVYNPNLEGRYCVAVAEM